LKNRLNQTQTFGIGRLFLSFPFCPIRLIKSAVSVAPELDFHFDTGSHYDDDDATTTTMTTTTMPSGSVTLQKLPTHQRIRRRFLRYSGHVGDPYDSANESHMYLAVGYQCPALSRERSELRGIIANRFRQEGEDGCNNRGVITRIITRYFAGSRQTPSGFTRSGSVHASAVRTAHSRFLHARARFTPIGGRRGGAATYRK
jgi:hypothetical protein